MQTLDTMQANMKATEFALNDILSRLMFQRRIRTTELARRINIPQPTLSRIMSGATTNPHIASLKSIADFFDLTIEQLKGAQPIPWLDPKSPETAGWKKIPLLGFDDARRWASEKIDISDKEHLFTDAKVSNKAYALTVKDASMEPQFPKETLLIIDPQKTPRDRSFVIAVIENYPEVMFRQLLIDGPHQYLKPISPDFDKFKMMLLGENDKLSGVLVQARRDYTE